LRRDQIERLHPALSGIRPSLLSGLAHLDDYSEGDRFDLVLRLLPSVDAAYLPFDALMIADLLEMFGHSGHAQILPSYWSEWQHVRTYYLMLNAEKKIATREVEFIRIRRGADVSPRIDDLVWMVHEVGHHFLGEHHTALAELFERYWAAVQGDLAVARLNATGITLQRALDREAKLEALWKPKESQQDWTHELVIDALCLWTLGPAYVWAFVQEHLADPEAYEPHQIDNHPPRRLRAETIREAAVHLGWGSEAKEVQHLLEVWAAKPDDASASNTYTSLSRRELIQGVHETAWALAERFDLERLSRQHFEALDPTTILDQEDFTARDLIICAWKQRLRLPTLAALEQWEEVVVSSVLAGIED